MIEPQEGAAPKLIQNYQSLLPAGDNGKGTPHNDLFVSLANAMGVAIDTFGDPGCCNGPLAGL